MKEYITDLYGYFKLEGDIRLLKESEHIIAQDCISGQLRVKLKGIISQVI